MSEARESKSKLRHPVWALPSPPAALPWEGEGSEDADAGRREKEEREVKREGR